MFTLPLLKAFINFDKMFEINGHSPFGHFGALDISSFESPLEKILLLFEIVECDELLVLSDLLVEIGIELLERDGGRRLYDDQRAERMREHAGRSGRRVTTAEEADVRMVFAARPHRLAYVHLDRVDAAGRRSVHVPERPLLAVEYLALHLVPLLVHFDLRLRLHINEFPFARE